MNRRNKRTDCHVPQIRQDKLKLELLSKMQEVDLLHICHLTLGQGGK